MKRFCGHAHTMYSNIRLIDCINKPKDLILKAAELGLSGIALTDHETLGGHVQWLKIEKELKESKQIPEDFKCALGNEIYLVEDRNNIERYWHYILIAKNTEGHKALRELSSIAWLHGFSSRGMMRVPTEMKELENIVHKYPNSLIATNACIGGLLGNRVIQLTDAEKDGDEKQIFQLKSQIDKFIKWNLDLFGDDFYFEIAAGKSEEQIKLNQRIKPIVKAYGGKLVIGDDAHYLTSQQRQIHKMYLNSKEGDREVDAFYAYSHLMSNEEAYQNLSDIYSESEFQEMCQNSLDMQNKIETYDIFHDPIIPCVEVKQYIKRKSPLEINKYSVLSSLMESDIDQERYWANQCLESLRNKGLWSDQYLARIEEEARIIQTVGNKLHNCLFEYFNTFQHYIDLFWECGSMVGPGRGSSVCFLTNYLLGITQLDPIKWGLKEWRFLNDDRLELPDIDIDLNPTKRNKIFQEIRKERGELNLIQVCTWGTEGTRSAIAAACRGYRSEEYPKGVPIEESSYISSLVPVERGKLWSISDCILGNEEKGRKPVSAMVSTLNKYPNLFEGIRAIEGLVNKRGIHASGVMLYNNSPYETNALMRSPSGDITTQFDLHDSEALGDTKFDFLVTEICDKITLCIGMLQQDNLLDPNKSLREIYDLHFHPEVIDVTEPKIWEALGKGEVLDVFQFSTGVGLSTAKRIKPKNPTELTSANALMRLMGEDKEERPMDRYCRFKDDMKLWYEEAKDAGLTAEEIKILEPYYLPNFGVPCAQEDLMEVCMDQNIAHFTLSEANHARKVVAKKKTEEVDELKEKFISQCPRREFGEYVWKTVAGPQMGYSFSTPHALAYSFVGIITLHLGVLFPSVYWNCACLIVNAGSAELLDPDSENTANSPDYGKISVALGISRSRGIYVQSPNINESGMTFKPDGQSNTILYGLKGINFIGDALVREIMEKRPYNSINDFLNKVAVNKTQMISLVKSGAFDSLYQNDRNKAMQTYVNILFPVEEKITFSKLKTLMSYNLIPEELSWYTRVFNFNKYLKAHKYQNYYELDGNSAPFYFNYFDDDNIIYMEGKELLSSTNWNKTYNSTMEKLKIWINSHQELLTTQLADKMRQDFLRQYVTGDINTWDMESLGTYCHQHELANFNQKKYGIVDFSILSPDPQLKEMGRSMSGDIIRGYDLVRVCGTIIAKNRIKKTITLLDVNMNAINIKMKNELFSYWDRQISRKNPDGTKTVIEKSFFERGVKIIVTGIRRGDDFVPKKYKKTTFPMFEKILVLNQEGDIVKSVSERAREE